MQGESPKEKKISLSNGQAIIIDDYTEIVTLNMVREFLGEGFQHHLLTNPIMHSLLDYTPVDFHIERGSLVEKVSKQKARNESRRLCAAYKSSIIL